MASRSFHVSATLLVTAIRIITCPQSVPSSGMVIAMSTLNAKDQK